MRAISLNSMSIDDAKTNLHVFTTPYGKVFFNYEENEHKGGEFEPNLYFQDGDMNAVYAGMVDVTTGRRAEHRDSTDYKWKDHGKILFRHPTKGYFGVEFQSDFDGVLNPNCKTWFSFVEILPVWGNLIESE